MELHRSPQDHEPAETRITAADCAGAGLAAIDLRIMLELHGFRLLSSTAERSYLAASDEEGARIEVLPAEGVSAEHLAAWLEKSIEVLAPVHPGCAGEVFVAGASRPAVTALTLGGGVAVLHLAALVRDTHYAPMGVAIVVRVPWAQGDDPVPSPEALAAMGTPVAEVMRSVSLGTAVVGGRPAMLVPSLGAKLSEPVARRVPKSTAACDGTAPPPTLSAELTFSEQGAPVRHRLRARETLGRARDNTVVVVDTMTSKYHATIEWNGEHFVLTDLGSINGTRVEGRLVRAPTVLRHGNTIELGRLSMHYHELDTRPTAGPLALAHAFAQAGLAMPPLPSPLGEAIRMLGPWFYATASLPAPPLHGDLGVSLGAADHLVIAYGPAHAATPTLQYVLALGPLRVALECMLGGSVDATLARMTVAASFHGVRALLGAVAQTVRRDAWPKGVVLEVRAIEGLMSFWSPIGAGKERRAPGPVSTPPPDTLADALAWVHAR